MKRLVGLGAVMSTIVVAALGTTAGVGGAVSVARPTVICGNCTDGGAPPMPCDRGSGDFAMSWQGHVWLCYGGTWYYGG